MTGWRACPTTATVPEMRLIGWVCATLLGSAAIAHADGPVVEAVEAREQGGAWRFSVTLSHPDTGWDHYADGWEVIAPDGTRLGYRPLAHPHVNEQPFTRSQSGIEIPNGLETVLVRGRDNGGDWGPSFEFELP